MLFHSENFVQLFPLLKLLEGPGKNKVTQKVQNSRHLYVFWALCLQAGKLLFKFNELSIYQMILHYRFSLGSFGVILP